MLNNALFGGIWPRGERVMEIVVRTVGICCETAEGDGVGM